MDRFASSNITQKKRKMKMLAENSCIILYWQCSESGFGLQFILIQLGFF